MTTSLSIVIKKNEEEEKKKFFLIEKWAQLSLFVWDCMVDLENASDLESFVYMAVEHDEEKL